MTSKWINIAAACGIAVTFITGCTSTRKQQPKRSGPPAILENRDLVPRPYSSPDAVRGITPARPNATAPILPGNLAFNNNTIPPQPTIPTYVPPQQDTGAEPQAVTTSSDIQSLFPTLENADGPAATPTKPKGPSKNQQVSMASRNTPPKTVKPTVFEPPAAISGSPKTTPAISGRTVTVKSGDTLSGIAYKYGVKTDTLASVNGIDKNGVLRIGTVLALPAGALETPRAPKSHPAPQSGNIKKGSTSPAAPGKAAGAATAPKEGTHVVKANENLWKIAKAYKVKFEDIQKWNPEYANKMLQPGQVIYVKDPSKVASAPADKTSPVPDKKVAAAPQNPPPKNNAPDAAAPKPAAGAKEPIAVGGLPPQPQNNDADLFHYTVQEKDTLAILARMYGTTVEAIKKQNPSVQSDNDLKPGMTIDIPYTLLKP